MPHYQDINNNDRVDEILFLCKNRYKKHKKDLKQSVSNKIIENLS